jgi:hypothetical protein
MNKAAIIFGGLLVFALGAAWLEYTGERPKEKVGVVLLESKKEELETLLYKTKDLEVVYEVKRDAIGPYAWVTVTENKTKKVEGQDTPYTKVTKFKAGSAGDKLVESLSPVMALRDLDKPEEAKLESFGLKEAESTFELTSRGTTLRMALGGETYGTKDRYVQELASGKVYVVDDDVFKPLKFANSRLPERGTYSYKKEEVESFSLGQGANTVTWLQVNRDDKAAVYWDRQVSTPGAAAEGEGKNPAAASGGKDETFSNWFDTWSKLKSTAYVQDEDKPESLDLKFEVAMRASAKPEETIRFYVSGEDWYAESSFTRGLVKLSKGATQDSAEEVDDILEGRIPPEKPKPAKASPHGGPPGLEPHGAEGGPPRPPGMPPRPPMPRPTGPG